MTQRRITGYSEECWTPVLCPDHGESMLPRGRDSPFCNCCDNYQEPSINPRHLCDEHDRARQYVDKDGWDKHYDACPRCNPKLEEL